MALPPSLGRSTSIAPAAHSAARPRKTPRPHRLLLPKLPALRTTRRDLPQRLAKPGTSCPRPFISGRDDWPQSSAPCGPLPASNPITPVRANHQPRGVLASRSPATFFPPIRHQQKIAVIRLLLAHMYGVSVKRHQGQPYASPPPHIPPTSAASFRSRNAHKNTFIPILAVASPPPPRRFTSYSTAYTAFL